MNFDDLHDPDPPRPGVDTLAAVAGRARQIRRRRVALVAAGGALAIALVAVPLTLAVTGDSSGGRLVPATVPPAVDETVTPTGVATTTTTTTTTTVAPAPTTGAPVAPPPPDDAATTEPAETAAPTATAPASTSSTAPPGPTDVVAITADGDAVLLGGADGATTVLLDGPDPAAEPPEGSWSVVDSAAVAPGGRRFVSTCCEPVPGAWVEVGPGLPPEGTFRGYGHGLDLHADGRRLLTVGAQGIAVADLDGTVLERAPAASDEAAAGYRDPYQARWLDGDRVVVLEMRQDGSDAEFRLYTAGSLAATEAAEGVAVGGGDLDAPWPLLAGVGPDGSLLVFQGEGDDAAAMALQAYDPVTLERGPDVDLPGGATYASVDGGVLTWIDAAGTLHVGDEVLGGGYRWARPVP